MGDALSLQPNLVTTLLNTLTAIDQRLSRIETTLRLNGPNIPNHGAEGRRKPTTDRASKKCGCLFKFEVIETMKGSDVWILHYPNEEHKVHNHAPSDQTSDPRARKLPPYMLMEVDQWLREGWLVSKIQEELKNRNFHNVLNTDLYNRKRLLRKEDNNSMSQLLE
ncbi:hypothetical protein B0T18DRAFT_185018 [Schizothecium vesticola]|uniref:FAR1 domain-containing protein n=1 Tax=Schizothecium vesticola TaxID=314040 RepID=A0AA40EQ72_9PEZI|nr:hypothetical protein B0T18DRAFT_185018 [Schizothecium vesticola]